MNKPLWTLSDEKYEFIKGEAVHHFKQYNVKCIPVSGFELAIKMGITLIAYSSLKGIKLKKATDVNANIKVDHFGPFR